MGSEGLGLRSMGRHPRRYSALLAGLLALVTGTCGCSSGDSSGDPVTGEPVPDGWCAEVSQHGVTWTFAQAHPCGQFINGDWWVVGPVEITHIDPVSAEYPGETEDEAPRTMHGSMLNPTHGSSQGFDSHLCAHPNGYESGYDPTLNAARPNGQGLSPSNPLVVSEPATILSTISRTLAALQADQTSSNKRGLRTASVLTVLDAIPPADGFRPSYGDTSKDVRFLGSQLDFSFLKNLAHVDGMPTLVQPADGEWNDSLEGTFERIPVDLSSSSVCSWNPLESVALYGRNLSISVAHAMLMLSLDFTAEEKQTAATRLVQLGIDFAGIFDAGGYWPSNGGIYSGRKLPVLFAGQALDDPHMSSVGEWRVDTMYSADPLPITLPFQDDGQIFYVSETDPAEAFSTCEYETSPTNINHGCGGYTEDHLGMPEYGIRHQQRPAADSISMDAPYRGVNIMGYVPTALAVQILELRPAWNHPPFLDYADRMWQHTCDDGDCGAFGNTRVSDLVENLWDAHRDPYGCKYVGVSSATHTRTYDCEGQQLDCDGISACADYPNSRASAYDPCQLGCSP